MHTLINIFRHTERSEFFFYAVFGLTVAMSPILMRLIPSLRKRFITKAASLPAPVFELFNRYGYIFCFICGILIFFVFIDFRGGQLSMIGAPVEMGYLHFLGLIISSAILMWFITKDQNQKITSSKNGFIYGLIIFCFFLFVFAINLSTDFFKYDESTMHWYLHNWGAFISAAKSLDAGLAIFNDFPTQYGFGPSLLIAQSSHYFGWITGLFYVVGLLQFLFWLSLVLIAYKVINKPLEKSYAFIVFILLSITFSCFFWVPDAGFYSNLAPSLGGTRYFPAVMFVAILFWLDLTRESNSAKKLFLMHFLWALGCLWSVESAFYVCLIWWPYYIFIRLPDDRGLNSGLNRLVKPIIELLSVAAGFMASVIMVYWVKYSSLPDPSVYMIFLNNIPGRLLIDFSGPFIFIVLMFFMAISSMFFMYLKHGDTSRYHRLFALTLLAYAALSYYIGRSADYNIRALMPFFVLLLIAMFQVEFPMLIRNVSISLLCIMMCWVIVDQYNKGFIRFYFKEFDGTKLNSRFQAIREDPINSDLGRSIVFINKNYNESVVAIDSVFTITLSGRQEQWNSYNNIASYTYLPLQFQKKIIARSKEKLMKSGWVLVHKKMGIYGESFIIDLFSDSYDLDSKLSFGDYTALRFIPKV